MATILAVHGGAGVHKSRVDRVCANAVRHATGSIVEAIKFMEDESSTNCATGSNLSDRGCIECEAAIAHSKGGLFGAVGAVSRIRNPIEVASLVASESTKTDSRRLVPPLVLVGEGAEKFAESRGIRLCEATALITENAKNQWEKAKAMMTSYESKRLDTVGAVSVDASGNCSAACSSGGFLLKVSGRLSHCTQIGGAVWAEQQGTKSVALSLSGCGEYIARTLLAQRLAFAMFNWDSESTLLSECIRTVFVKEFLNSPLLSSYPSCRILAGGLALFCNKDDGFTELLFFHNTEHFPVAYGCGKDTKKVFSTKPPNGDFIIESFPLRL